MTQPISKPMDWETVDKLIALRGRCDIAAEKLAAQMNAKLAAVRESYARRVSVLEQTTDRVDAVLQEFATEHRDEMNQARTGGQSYTCLAGRIAFRKLPPKIKFLKKVEAVLAALKAAKLTNCIRTVEEPNKDTLLTLDAATLKRVHVKKDAGEQFEVVPDYEEITKNQRMLQ